jgi:hypothetical protein
MFLVRRALRCPARQGYLDKIAQPDMEIATRNGKVFENQILAGTDAIRRTMTPINLGQTVTHLWTAGFSQERGQTTYSPPLPAIDAIKQVATAAAEAMIRHQLCSDSDAQLKKLQTVSGTRNFAVRDVECDAAWMVTDPGAIGDAQAALTSFLRNAGSKYTWATPANAAAPMTLEPMSSLHLRRNPTMQVVMEICIAGAGVPYKLFQLEKHLQLMRTVARDHGIEESFLPVVFVNVDEKDALRGIAAGHDMLQHLRSVPSDDQVTRPIIARSDVLLCYTPFRNVYTMMYEMSGRLGDLQADVDRRFDETNRETNRRFDETNRRFDETNRRFDLSDRRLDRIEQLLEQLVKQAPK